MALIVDPDLLADSAADDGSTEVYINTATKTIKLVVVGDLSNDGVTLKALYSFLKEEWKNDPNSKNLAAFQFPMVPITDEEFELVGGWDFFNDTARYLIRTGGWTVKNLSSATTAIWAGIIGLGSVESNDQPYFWQGGATSPTNFQLQGQINQAIQVYRDDDGDGNTSEGSDFDRRTSLTLYVREQGQTFGQATLADIGVTSMKGQVYRFPLSTAADLKIVVADTGIKASGSGYPADVAPYAAMTITYYATPQSRALQGGNYNFGVVVNANGQTLQKAYEFVEYALRQNADIDADAGTVTGKIAAPLLRYVGDTLYTQASDYTHGGGTGVFIDNFASADLNSVFFTDNTGAQRQFAYTANLTINFNENLVADGAAKYWVYFTTLPGSTNDWGESGAVIVDDASAADITGTISGASVTKTFDYDGNTQGGRTPGTDAAVTVVAIGLTTGQYVKATGTIARSKSNVVSLVAPLERNYANP
jgi:hypothetical protein